MKYALVARHEWDAESEGWPDNTFCVAFLNNDGTLAPEEAVEQIAGVQAGSGRVWAYPEGNESSARFLGFHSLPMDVVFYGNFNTENDAVRFAINGYVNDTVELENTINTRTEANIYLERYITDELDRQRLRDVIIFVLVVIAILFIVWGVQYIQRYVESNHSGAIHTFVLYHFTK